MYFVPSGSLPMISSRLCKVLSSMALTRTRRLWSYFGRWLKRRACSGAAMADRETTESSATTRRMMFLVCDLIAVVCCLFAH